MNKSRALKNHFFPISLFTYVSIEEDYLIGLHPLGDMPSDRKMKNIRICNTLSWHRTVKWRGNLVSFCYFYAATKIQRKSENESTLRLVMTQKQPKNDHYQNLVNSIIMHIFLLLPYYWHGNNWNVKNINVWVCEF